MDNLFREQSKTIKIYPAIETITDPFKKTVSKTYLNPQPIKAIVTDVDFSRIQYKMPGITTERAKEIIIKKKYETLLKVSQKIKIDNVEYYGWKINGKLQYRIEGSYIRAYVYIKKET